MVRPRKYEVEPPAGAIGVRGACELLGVSKPTLYRLMKEPGFPAHWLERGYTWLDRLEVEAWKSKRNPGTSPQ